MIVTERHQQGGQDTSNSSRAPSSSPAAGLRSPASQSGPLRISFARRNSRFSCHNSQMRALPALVTLDAW